LLVGGWWLVVGGCWLVVDGCWLVIGDWWVGILWVGIFLLFAKLTQQQITNNK
jgi:hypothetical protein